MQLAPKTIPFINVQIKMSLEEIRTNIQFFAQHIKSVCYVATRYTYLSVYTRAHNPSLNVVTQMPLHEISTNEQILQKL
jgi:hypothetical protein